jgi:hypothetical protein
MEHSQTPMHTEEFVHRFCKKLQFGYLVFSWDQTKSEGYFHHPKSKLKNLFYENYVKPGKTKKETYNKKNPKNNRTKIFSTSCGT